MIIFVLLAAKTNYHCCIANIIRMFLKQYDEQIWAGICKLLVFVDGGITSLLPLWSYLVFHSQGYTACMYEYTFYLLIYLIKIMFIRMMTLSNSVCAYVVLWGSLCPRL